MKAVCNTELSVAILLRTYLCEECVTKP